MYGRIAGQTMGADVLKKIRHPDPQRKKKIRGQEEVWQAIQSAYNPIDEAVIGFLPVVDAAEEDPRKS